MNSRAMNCTSLIIEKLAFRDIKATTSEFSITWPDYMGNENYIQFGDFDCIDDKLAWFQSNEKDEHLLCVYENSERFEWKPTSYNPYFGCTCFLLEWHSDSLIFIYGEKHDTYICALKDKEVKTVDFYGNKLSRLGEVIFFIEHGNEENIRRLQLPDLKELQPISKSAAEQQGILPTLPFGINPLKTVTKSN